MTEEFIKFLEELMRAAPEVVEKNMTENVRAYIDILYNSQKEKTSLTEQGKQIIKFLQENQDKLMWKSKDIADILEVPSRGLAPSFRKLVDDGYVEKIGINPVNYVLTEKGKNFKLEREKK